MNLCKQVLQEYYLEHKNCKSDAITLICQSHDLHHIIHIKSTEFDLLCQAKNQLITLKLNCGFKFWYITNHVFSTNSYLRYFGN